MRRRVGIHCATQEALQLIPALLANPEIEIAAIYDPNAEALRARLVHHEPPVAALLEARLTDDLGALLGDASLHAILDADPESGLGAQHPELAARGIQLVTPLIARLLWGFAAGHRKSELLLALQEIVESYNLTIDADELFTRMLETAVGVTGAEGGSLMLLDEATRELRVRVATGVEPELWPKIRVPLGEGIAGRAAAEGRPLRLRGRADRKAFHIVRERLDVESALCVPLVFEGRVLGVLNLHHSERPDAFSDADLEFAEQLARLDAQIIARSQEHEALRSQAARYSTVRRVRELLSGRAPLPERLHALCDFVAEHVGGGIATLYLSEPNDGGLRLGATSLEGGGFGGEYRVEIGQGIDGAVASTREPAFLARPGGALAYAALPLLAGDLLIGVLSVQGGGSAATGRAAEEELQELAAAAAESIAHAQSESRMAARTAQYNAINETGIRMISATDPAEVLRLATSAAAMVLEADHAVLRLHEPSTGRYVIRSYFGSADGRLQERLFRLDKHVSVAAIKQRAPRLTRNLAEVAETSELQSDVRSALAAPLLREGRVIGTLAVYDKIANDRFSVVSFGDDDLMLFSRFASYVERAVANALFHEETKQLRNFDPATGLPNDQYLAKRLREEIVRAGGREGAFAVAICLLENLHEIEREAGSARAHRVIERTIEALRAHLRDFDVLGRTGESELTMLLPDPGSSPGERVFDLARSVADSVSKDERLNDPIRVALGFGYAAFPEEGDDADTLLARARTPRIRMV